jgi:osmoprotectant transport system substrate-binding protein
MRISRMFALGATVLALALVGAACSKSGGGGNTPSGSARGTLTVGVSSAFPENQIVAEMYAQVLQHAGYTVNKQLDIMSREVSDPALASGQIDLKPEYLASELAGPLANAADKASGDANAELTTLQGLLMPKAISVLTPSQANDQNAFVVTQETSTRYNLHTVSDLAPVAGMLTLGGPPECPMRMFCAVGLKSVYNVTFGHFTPIGVCDSATADALDAGRIDVALLCSTQPIIADKGWVVLEDDKHLQNAENITPVIRTDKLNSEVTNLLNAVSAKLTTANVVTLSAKVAIDHEDASAVAKDFLMSNGLL